MKLDLSSFEKTVVLLGDVLKEYEKTVMSL
ncbi:MAG: hypothetical protein ACD_44C00336G0003 [uncultured bacterium]|nr:MAG: hypothetical protein ACD_44C00336G0003 [uncultured bacterium]